jgi:hypothetical protein
MRAITKLSVPSALAVSLALGATLAVSLPAAALTIQSGGPGDPAHRLNALHPVHLLLPQSTAFAILGHSCGGIGEHVYVTGFDLTSGYPIGDVYLSTTCGGSGHAGGGTTTYTAWAGVTWDFTGNALTATVLSSAPTVDPTFTDTDVYGDTIYNQSLSAYLVVPVPAAPIGVSAVQSGDAFQVSWTPTGVNPVAVLSSRLTATPVNSTAPVLTATVVGSAMTGVISSLQPSTTYLIRVVSTSTGGNSPASLPVSVTTNGATIPPGAPTGLTAYWTNPDPSGSTDTFIATWQAADPGDSPIDQYLIRITNGETGATTTQTVSGTTLTASFTVDWVPSWSMKVQAHNTFGWGPWSNTFTLGGL